jgi:aldehyde:ferredoxin oxidoreductase
MAELYGWVGKILFVDLTSGTIEIRSTTDYVPKFMGGRALAAKLYWDEVPPDCGALDPENRLIFASGPAGGTLFPSSRTAIATKSAKLIPQAYNESTPGGNWAAELKYAGFDALVVRGKAPDPCYLWIHDGEVEIKSAERLWGLTTSQAEAEIRRLWGDKTRTMLIGPAGENLCAEAVIMTDFAHATGNGAMGAIMGSKNLKAVAVRGTGGVRVKRPQDLIDFYDTHVRIGSTYGGPYPSASEAYHMLRKGEWGQTESIEDRFSKTSWWRDKYLAWEEVLAGTIKWKQEGCLACPVCCASVYLPVDPEGNEDAPKNLSAGIVQGQCTEINMMYPSETPNFGKRVGRPTVLNLESLRDMGLATDAMGGKRGWIYDAIAAGLVTKEMTGLDIPTNPDDLDAFYCSQEWLGKNGWHHALAYKKTPFWKRLAEEGSDRFTANMAKENPGTDWEKYYNPDFPYYHTDGGGDNAGVLIAVAVGWRTGQNDPKDHLPKPEKTIGGLMPDVEVIAAGKAMRAKLAPELGLGPKWFDVQSRRSLAEEVPGEDPTWEDKIPAAIMMDHWRMEFDSMPYCGWAGFPRWLAPNAPDHVGDPREGSALASAIMGIDYLPEQGLKAQAEGLKNQEAAFNLERCIFVREGRRREHDTPSEDAFGDPGSWNSKETFNKVLDDYYTARGWDVETGIPRRSKLEELGLKDVADDLENKYGVKVPA